MDEIALECKERLAKTVEALKTDLVTIRTGRASPAMLDRIQCDYYGDKIDITAISAITTPEPRQLLIKPYDRNDVKAIVTAINASDLGLNPINEGTQIRLMIPVLTEERRREITKQAHKYGEETKVSIRNVRRDYIDFIKNDDSMSEDYQKRVLDDMQKITDEAVKTVDQVIAEKDKELMSL